MLKYIFKRIFSSVITIWVVVTLTFFLMHAIPGSPFTGERKLPASVIVNLQKKWGLDKPVSQQYLSYLKNLINGDLGESTRYEGRTVNEIIEKSFPVSARLGLVSVCFSLAAGIYLGVVSALHHGKWQDQVCKIITTLGVCVPSFVLGTFLSYTFSVKFNIFPSIGIDKPTGYILPMISLSGFSMAFIARLTRSSLLDVLKQDYMRTAKAKGLPKNVIIYKHALKNALIPVITYTGPLIAGILTGSFVVEQIFGIPGLGKEFVTSIGNRDVTLIVGVTVFYGTFLVICNLIVDILYALIDPRIKLES
ncbi:MAG: ABC transporter permease [Bacillota bacterium]|nr:ABC transporter permease [Bacillota bacterium]